MGSTRTLFHQTANVTISNSTNETTILGSGVGSLVFPANNIFPGTVLKVGVSGQLQTTVLLPPTLRIRIYLGSGNIVLDTTAQALLSISPARRFSLEAAITIREFSATAAVIGNGIFNYNNGLTGAGVIEIPSNATTIDSTVSNTFNVTAQFGTAAANNVLTSEVAWLLALDPP